MVVHNSLILLLFFFKHQSSRPDAAQCAFFLQWLGPKSMQKPPWCRNPSGNRRSCANVVCVCFGKACCGLLLRGSCWACSWSVNREKICVADCKVPFFFLLIVQNKQHPGECHNHEGHEGHQNETILAWLEGHLISTFRFLLTIRSVSSTPLLLRWKLSKKRSFCGGLLAVSGCWNQTLDIWACVKMGYNSFIFSFFFHKYHTNPHGCSEFQQSTPAQETCLESAVSSSWQGLRADMVPWVAVRLKYLSDG